MFSTTAKSWNAIGTYNHHMPSNGGSAVRPAGSGSPIGRIHSKGPVAATDPGGWVDSNLLAVQ